MMEPGTCSTSGSASATLATPERGKRFRLRARDVEILREIFDYRCLMREHVLALFGTKNEVANTRARANTNLDRRLRYLKRAGYLKIPEATRRTWTLQGQNDLFTLTRSGAKLVAAHFREDERYQGIAEKNFDKEPSWPFLDHELEVARTLIAPRIAAKQHRIPFEYATYQDRDTLRIAVKTEKRSETVDPDGYFALEFPGKSGAPQTVHHFLEIDRSGSVNTKKMRTRYRRYFLWWLSVREAEGMPYRFTRVLTIAPTEKRRDFLRKIAADATSDAAGLDRDRAWGGLWFTTSAAFTLADPISFMKPIFFTATSDVPVSLVEPFISLSS